jgi:hypothetical protein
MIWLSRRVVFREIILTLNTYNLEFIGVFKFLVREKKIVKLQGAEVPQFCLYLSTETGDYGSTVTVSKKKYEQAKVEESFGLCGVIKNIKHDDFFLVTENTDPDEAIKKAVRKSWAKMIFIMVVFGLFLCSLLIFAYPILRLSRN